jgi:hypothetical protein
MHLCSPTSHSSRQNAATGRAAAAHTASEQPLKTLVMVLQAAMNTLLKARDCLKAPGSLPFHTVRQARGAALLLEVSAALLHDESACRSLLLQQELRGVVVSGGHVCPHGLGFEVGFRVWECGLGVCHVCECCKVSAAELF